MSRLLVILVLLISTTLQAQVKEPVKDSARIYRKIQEFSEKRKFTKFLHRLIFEPVKVRRKADQTSNRNVRNRSFKSFQGKIIRKITIETFDPFGYSEVNPDNKPTQYISRVGNALHLKSKQFTIRNLLLIKRNKPFDSLIVRESERLVRSQRYVRAVTINPKRVGTTDSVDVEIRVVDAWSLVPEFSASGNRANFGVVERNFLGWGHTVDNNYEREFSTGRDAYGLRYLIPNILNTYVQTEVAYDVNLEGDYIKSAQVDRPFFSPFARWAGGVLVEQVFNQDSIPDQNNSFQWQRFRYTTSDFWGGHSLRIFRGTSEEKRTTNFVTTFRYRQVGFDERPSVTYDSINFYTAERLYLAGIGISSRQYREDKLIFNYGIVEDVPIGRVVGITLGWQEKNNTTRPYFGARGSFGRYFTWGYFSTNLEYGTFFNQNSWKNEQSAISFQANYFTLLQEFGKWKMRHFAKLSAVIGMNRQPIFGDQITISDQNGIPGFNAPWLYGTKKVVLSLQTQAYSPWNLLGFRLNPYVGCSFGLLSGSGTSVLNSRVYPKLSAGFIVSNDFLVFSNFEINFSYYPTIPNVGESVFKTNAFSNQDFGFQEFELNRPELVDYR